MSHAKQVSRKRRGNAMPVLGAAGLLALASGASAKAPADTWTSNTGMSRQVLLGEEEISDVSLATFYVFDKENAGSLKPGVQLARGGCGGGGCGCGHGCVAAEASQAVARVAVAEVAESASALAVAAVVDAQDAAWAGGECTA
jgi:hypothetical protein